MAVSEEEVIRFGMLHYIFFCKADEVFVLYFGGIFSRLQSFFPAVFRPFVTYGNSPSRMNGGEEYLTDSAVEQETEYSERGRGVSQTVSVCQKEIFTV